MVPSISRHTPNLLRRLNSRRILTVLRDEDGISRADIARKAGMSRPTVSTAVADLVKKGLVQETGEHSKGVGRHGTHLGLNTTKSWLVAVLVNIHKTEITAGTLAGNSIGKVVRFETPDTWRLFLSSLEKNILAIIRQNKTKPLGIALSMPGMSDDETGDIFFSANLQFLNNKNVVKILQEHLTIPVIQIQETRAIALGAFTSTETARLSNTFCLDIGEGVGGALAIRNELLSGAHHSAGEIGHMPIPGCTRRCGCGRVGCLETILGNKGLLLSLKEKVPIHTVSTTFVEACALHPLETHAVFISSLPALAHTLTAVVRLVDPQHIVLHGTIWQIFPDAIQELSLLLDCAVPLSSCANAGPKGLFNALFNRVVLNGIAKEVM
jgi:predicted NBD/HSP70 family sugar kinase